jgi:hypothetical protein
MAIGGPAGDDNPCVLCNGTGELDGEFHYPCLGTGYRAGLEIAVFLKELKDNLDTKLDALQADMDIIKPQIDALYEDLNP